MQYEIHIGEVFDISRNMMGPAKKIIITEDQYSLIKEFANVEKDENANDVYVLNKCKFKIVFHFENKPLSQ